MASVKEFLQAFFRYHFLVETISLSDVSNSHVIDVRVWGSCGYYFSDCQTLKLILAGSVLIVHITVHPSSIVQQGTSYFKLIPLQAGGVLVCPTPPTSSSLPSSCMHYLNNTLYTIEISTVPASGVSTTSTHEFYLTRVNISPNHHRIPEFAPHLLHNPCNIQGAVHDRELWTHFSIKKPFKNPDARCFTTSPQCEWIGGNVFSSSKAKLLSFELHPYIVLVGISDSIRLS